MQSASSAVKMFERISAAMSRAKGGQYQAFSLVAVLDVEGLDITERASPDRVTEAMAAIETVALPIRDAAE